MVSHQHYSKHTDETDKYQRQDSVQTFLPAFHNPNKEGYLHGENIYGRWAWRNVASLRSNEMGTYNYKCKSASCQDVSHGKSFPVNFQRFIAGDVTAEHVETRKTPTLWRWSTLMMHNSAGFVIQVWIPGIRIQLYEYWFTVDDSCIWYSIE